MGSSYVLYSMHLIWRELRYIWQNGLFVAQASLDEPTQIVVMHRTEPTRLQSLALQLSEKVGSLVDNNERVMEIKQGNFFFNKGSKCCFFLFSFYFVESGTCLSNDSIMGCIIFWQYFLLLYCDFSKIFSECLHNYFEIFMTQEYSYINCVRSRWLVNSCKR